MQINTNKNLYETFIVAYETLNLYKTADILMVTRSAVGQKIKELGNQIGVKLFTPTTRGIVPTPEAHNLYAAVKNAMQNIIDAEISLQKFDEQSTGVIRIAVPQWDMEFYLKDYLREFSAKYPNVRFEFFGQESNKLLSEGKLDFVFNLDIDFKNTDFRVRNLFSIKSAFAVSPQFFKGKNLKQTMTLDEVLKYPIIAERTHWADFSRQNNITKTVQIETDSQFAAYSLAKNGQGICLYCDRADPNLVLLNVTDITPTPINISVAFNRNLSKPAKTFFDCLVKFCASN
jgi:DNA-binding transcriptional LysR family regulator